MISNPSLNLDYFPIIQELNLKTTSLKNSKTLLTMIYLSTYQQNKLVFIFQSFFVLFSPRTKSQIRVEFLRSFKSLQAFPYRHGFIIYSPQPLGFWQIDIQGEDIRIQEIDLKRYKDEEYLPLYCEVSQEFIVFVTKEGVLLRAYRVQNKERIWAFSGIHGMISHYKASFVEPWIMTKRLNSKKMMVLFNPVTQVERYIDVPLRVTKLLLLNDQKVIVIRKLQDKISIQLIDLPAQMEQTQFEDIQSQVLISFPSKTQIEIKLVNYEHRMLGIQANNRFILFEYSEKQVKWSTQKVNEMFHKEFEGVKACSLDLKDMVLESRGRYYRHRFVGKRSLYHNLCSKSDLKGLYGEGLMVKVVEVLGEQ